MSPGQVIRSVIETADLSAARTQPDLMRRIELSYQQIKPGIGYIELTGRLDILGAQQAELAFTCMTARRRNSVIVEMSKLELITSDGLGMLISSATALKADRKLMVLLNPSPRAEKLLRMARVDLLMPIEYDLNIAITRIKIAEI